MSRIERALQTADQTRAIAFGRGVLDRTGPMFRELFGDRPVLVVADENTFGQAGAQVLASLQAAGVRAAAEPLVFPGTPTLYAGYENVTAVRDRLAELPDAVVCSIAAGSLNDIAKLASGELGRPYMNVCTAASVDGYSAFGASIAIDGFKITRNCPAPVGLVDDLDVIDKAPQRLTSTGFGDLSEKIPAGADWILADELGVEAIDPVSWSLVQDSALEALQQAEGIGTSQPAAIASLMESLVLSGLGMQAHKSSRPASGAGHQFSHTWEMEGHGLDWEPPLSHGFKVGVGAVASCAIWEAALALDLSTIDVDAVVAQALTPEQVEAQVRAAIPATFADESVAASQAKLLQGDALRARLTLIQQRWPAIVERVRPQLVTAERMAEMLKQAGAPYHPKQIGISMERLRTTHQMARMIRARYTVFDVLADLGVYDQVIADLFAPTGFWGRREQA